MSWETSTLFGNAVVILFLIWQSNLIDFKSDGLKKIYLYLVSWMGSIYLIAVTRAVLQESNPAAVFSLGWLDTLLFIVIMLFVVISLYFVFDFFRSKAKKHKEWQVDADAVRVAR